MPWFFGLVGMVEIWRGIYSASRSGIYESGIGDEFGD
jgi:hypothetical protein